MSPERLFKLYSRNINPGPVIYWMQRDQRIADNWALIYAQEKAFEMKQPLLVVFCLVPEFLHANAGHFGFMLRNLAKLPAVLASKNIGFTLVKGYPPTVIPQLVEEYKAGLLVTDFNPLRLVQQWKTEILGTINTAFHEVDAHNVIPARHISQKSEFSAFTLRKKIQKALPAFLSNIPVLKTHPFTLDNMPDLLADDFSPELPAGKGLQDLSWIRPGEKEAAKSMDLFIREGLNHYDEDRNDPNLDAQSGLSPYLHFGQLSAQRLALAVSQADAPSAAREAFLEELIVRRELADNFCLYNPAYDSFDGFQNWARTTLNKHRGDAREFHYEPESFEMAETHDPLWNAAQRQMVRTGKMHGFMRMYWAKKILEWTPSPEEAMAVAIWLNDKYSLDGRDPNGYAGISWSIGGTHDRPWAERPVFGMIRYMNYQGCRRKFDVDCYVRAWA